MLKEPEDASFATIMNKDLLKSRLSAIICNNSSKIRIKGENSVIKRFWASNFQSFYDEVEVDLMAGKAVQSPEKYISLEDGSNLSLIATVVGHNASGKTALLKIPSFLAWFNAWSFREQDIQQSQIPIIPHFSHPDKVIKLGIDFEVKGVDYKYSVEIINNTVLKESLYKKRERFGFVFIREWDSLKHQYKVKSQDFELPKKEAEKVKHFISLISAAAQYGEPTALAISNFFKFKVVGNVQLGGTLPNHLYFDAAINYFATNEQANNQLQEMLKNWDLGLAKIEYHKERILINNVLQDIWLGEGIHEVDGKSHRLQFAYESDGTKIALVRLNIILQILNSGGLAIIDEIEAGLHPVIVKELISLFSNPAYNLAKGQLIFSSHLPQVLNEMDKSQIYLVEKDEMLESHAYPLSDVEGVRNIENFGANYLAGAYGAVPKI